MQFEYEYKDKKISPLARVKHLFINRLNRLPTVYGWIGVLVIVLILFRTFSSPPEPKKVIIRNAGRGRSFNPKFGALILRPDPQEEEFKKIEERNKAAVDGQLPEIPVFDMNKHSQDGKVIPKDGYDHPNPKSFPVDHLHTPRLSCTEGSIPLLLVVHSKASNVGGRRAIRKSWGIQNTDKYPIFKTPKWTTIFVMGKPSKIVQKEVDDESKEFGDVLQGDFFDSPYENTRRFMLGMQWVVKNIDNCKPQFVLKTEDNIFHNMHAIVNWLEKKYTDVTGTHYVGKLLRKDQPIRDKKDPLYVPARDYAKEFFPDLIQGPEYLFSSSSYISMAKSMGKVTPIAMEDAYVGLLAEAAEITPRHNDHFHMLSKSVNLCHHLKVFFLFDVKPSGHTDIFKKLKIARKKPECLDALELDPIVRNQKNAIDV